MKKLSQVVLGLALLASPSLLVGCGEEPAKPAADAAAAPAPAPAPGGAAPAAPDAAKAK